MVVFSLIIMSQQNWCYGNGFGDWVGYVLVFEMFECDNQIDWIGIQFVEFFCYV